MAASFYKTPGSYCFAGNPIIYEFASDTPGSVEIHVSGSFPTDKEKSFSVSCVGKYAPYIGRIDLSEYISSVLSSLSYTLDASVIVGKAWSYMNTVHVTIVESSSTLSTTVFRGGISNRAYMTLAAAGQDMFSYRLRAVSKNRLFTTRTNSQTIELRDTELYPFIFISTGEVLTAKSESGNIVTIPASSSTANWVYSLNLALLRAEFERLYGEIPSSIKIFSGTKRFVQFEIKPGAVSEEKYLIRFLNSLGAYEVVEVTGRAYHTPEIKEENTWLSPNANYLYQEKRDRVKFREIYEVETGYKTRSEHTFLMDMINSNELYFTLPDGRETPCLVSAENVKFGERLITPNSLPLKVRLLFDESFYTPEIDLSTQAEGGIFDPTFDETFN